jgi:hypothetical protein
LELFSGKSSSSNLGVSSIEIDKDWESNSKEKFYLFSAAVY